MKPPPLEREESDRRTVFFHHSDFDVVPHRRHGEGEFRAEVGTGQRGIGFLRSLDPDERFFLFLHTYSIHDPYSPPEPYRSWFSNGEVVVVNPNAGPFRVVVQSKNLSTTTQPVFLAIDII